MNRIIEIHKTIRESKKKRLLFSSINALLLLLVCYLVDNFRYSILSGPSIGQHIEQFRGVSSNVNETISDDYLFINIAYDRQLVPVYDEYGLPMGNIDITDRNKLTQFVNKLDNSHKYILMDVLLSDKYRSENDSSLIASLLSTERISISRSSTADLIDNRLNKIAGYIDYSTSIFEDNFVKYEFIQDGELTLPYMAYLSMEPHSSVHSFGPIYWSNSHFHWKSIILRFPIKLWDTHIHNDGEELQIFKEKKILNLGTDILAMGTDVPALVKDKIVVIGDFTENDIHDTYLGKISGPTINANALEALLNHELEISWSLILFLFIFYTLNFYFILRNPITLDVFLGRIHMNKTKVKYLLSLIGYSFLFTIVGAGIYIIYGDDINILIPTLWLTSYRVFVNKFTL